MFYSNEEFYNAVQNCNDRYDTLYAIKRACTNKNNKLVKARVKRTLSAIKQALLAREENVVVGKDVNAFPERLYLGKIMRPWNIVPALRDFSPPEGDFGVGVEIEYGFTSNNTAKTAMYHIRNWKHVALDREGGFHGVEATFPPLLYSKLSKRDKPFRYLDYLAANSNMLASHNGMVGTHINVSAHILIPYERRASVVDYLRMLSDEQNARYFNRAPYGYINSRSESSESVGYVEMKMFNSTTCSITLRRYINIAVSLVKLMTSNISIDEASVLAALEEGYNKRNGHPKQP